MTADVDREGQVLQRWGWDVLGASTEEEARDPCRWLCAPVNVATLYAEGTLSGTTQRRAAADAALRVTREGFSSRSDGRLGQ